MSATEVRKAFAKHETSIAQNLESMTLKSVRQQLADDMGVDPDSLKAHKDLIASLVDKMIASHQGQKSNKPNSAAKGGTKSSPASKLKPKAGPQKVVKKQAVSDDEDDEDDEISEIEDDASNSSSGNSGLSSPSPKKNKGALKTRKINTKPASGAQKAAPSTERLKQLCRGASISIPTSLYARHRDDAGALDEALGELLGRHGLHARSTASEVAKVKASLELQRDLEGIDTSNIVQGGRRRAAAHRRPLREADSEEDSEEEEELQRKKPRPAKEVSRRAMLEESEESEASEADKAKTRGRSSEDGSEGHASEGGSEKESGSEDDVSSAPDNETFSASEDDVPAKAPRRKGRSLVSSSEESD